MMTASATFGAVPGRGMMAALSLRGEDAARALIFDAGKDCAAGDPLARFYAEEILELDWLRDYVMDENLAALGHDLAEGFKLEDEIDEVYNKADLTTVAADGNWAEG